MMSPIDRQIVIGIVIGAGLVNLLWMAIHFNHVSMAIVIIQIVILTAVYLDMRRYYAGIEDAS